MVLLDREVLRADCPATSLPRYERSPTTHGAATSKPTISPTSFGDPLLSIPLKVGSSSWGKCIAATTRYRNTVICSFRSYCSATSRYVYPFACIQSTQPCWVQHTILARRHSRWCTRCTRSIAWPVCVKTLPLRELFASVLACTRASWHAHDALKHPIVHKRL